MPAAVHPRPVCLALTVLLLACLLAPVSLGGWQQEPAGEAGPGASFSTLPIARSPVRGLADPRQLLYLYGIDESHLRFLIDGEDLLPEEIDVVTKILMRFDDLGHENILRWISPSVPWEELVLDAEKHRIGFFRVQGIARRVQRQEIVPEAAVLYGFDHFFWIFLDMPGGQKVRVASRKIPSSWPLDVPLSEPAAARAMYLKHGLEEHGGEFFLFSASRIEWYPEVVSSSLGVSDGLVALAGMGMDVSLFDDVRSRNRRSLGSQERDCFYRLLELLGGETQPAQAIQPGPVELIELLRSPQQHHGDYLDVKGTVRRITRIEIPDKDVQLRFGIQHYYQMDLFMPLGDQTIQIKLNPNDEQGLKFTNQFPLVACVQQLPPHLASAQRQLEEGTYAGSMLNEAIRLRGFFFKIWGYQSSFSSTDDTPRRQLSPMILAFEPEVVDLETGQDGPLGLVLSVLFAAVLLGIWLFTWRSGRRSRDVLKARREREPPTSAEQFKEMARQLEQREDPAEPT